MSGKSAQPTGAQWVRATSDWHAVRKRGQHAAVGLRPMSGRSARPTGAQWARATSDWHAAGKRGQPTGTRSKSYPNRGWAMVSDQPLARGGEVCTTRRRGRRGPPELSVGSYRAGAPTSGSGVSAISGFAKPNCCRTRRAYSPFCSTSASCRPVSIIRPPRITSIRSA